MAGKHNRYKLFSDITSIYIVLLLTVFLFYVGEAGYQEIAVAKFDLFRLLCGGYIILMVLAFVGKIITGEVRPDFSVLKKSSVAQKLAVVYLIFTWISAILSPYFPVTVWGATRFEGAMTITIYGFSFLLVSAFGEVSQKVLYVLGTAVFLFCGICILQLRGDNPMGLFPEGMTYFDGHIKYAGAYLGTIGNVDMVAAFLTMMTALLWIGLLRMQGKQRFLLLIPLALCLFVSLKMFVLAGIVGIFAGGILALPIVYPDGGRKRKLLGAVVLLLVVGLIAFVYLVDMGSGMLHEIHQIFHGNFDNAFGSARMYIWKSVLALVPTNLLFGTGPDTMIYADITPFKDFHADLQITVVNYIDAAHNEYLNVLYHQGLLALLAYLLLLGTLAVKWIRRSPADHVTAMLGGAAFCYCVQAFFGFSMFATAPFFWVILGLLDRRTRKEN